MTSVVGSVASAFLTCADGAAAATAVGPFWYLTMVLIVQAASSAVIGLPSDHLVSGLSLNVQSLPSAECVQESAQSPTSTSLFGSSFDWRVLDELRIDHDHGVVDCDSM